MAWSSPALYQLVDSEIENGLKEERGREGRRDGERKRRKRAGGEEESPDGVEGELRQKVEGREEEWEGGQRLRWARAGGQRSRRWRGRRTMGRGCGRRWEGGRHSKWQQTGRGWQRLCISFSTVPFTKKLHFPPGEPALQPWDRGQSLKP